MRKFGLGFAVLLLISASPVRAEYMYRFDAASYTVAAGNTVDVQVFLRETTTTTLNTYGLVSAGVQVSQSASGFAQIVAVTDIMGNVAGGMSGFTVQVRTNSPGSNAQLRLLDTVPPAAKPPVGSNEIFLGTFRFTGLSAGTFTITAADIPVTADTVLGPAIPPTPPGPPAGTPIDGMIAPASATFTVTGVIIPEPASMMLFGIGAVAVGFYARRRRKAVAA